jgi:hypothetical protein
MNAARQQTEANASRGGTRIPVEPFTVLALDDIKIGVQPEGRPGLGAVVEPAIEARKSRRPIRLKRRAIQRRSGNETADSHGTRLNLAARLARPLPC